RVVLFVRKVLCRLQHLMKCMSIDDDCRNCMHGGIGVWGMDSVDVIAVPPRDDRGGIGCHDYFDDDDPLILPRGKKECPYGASRCPYYQE
ncbi:MAG: hypothetical protein V1725_01375, partial [archaeon]